MNINNTHPSSPLHSISEIHPLEKPVAISEGNIIELPDGKSFKIDYLNIGGIERTAPFTTDELKHIQAVVQKTFDTSKQLKNQFLNAFEITHQENDEHTKIISNINGHKDEELIKDDELNELFSRVKTIFATRVNSTSHTPISTRAPIRQKSNTTIEQQATTASSVVSQSLGSTRDLDSVAVSSRIDASSAQTNMLKNGQRRAGNHLLTETYEFNDGIERTEKITRNATITWQINFLDKMIAATTEKIKQCETQTGPEIEKLMKKLSADLEFLTDQKALAVTYQTENRGKDWLHSNYVRDLIKAEGSFNKGIKKYLSLPINMRYQEIDINGKRKAGFFRVGVISDMRNGWISLKDLESMSKKPTGRKLFLQKIDFLEKQLKNVKKGSNEEQSIKYGLKQLQNIRKFGLSKAIAARKQILSMQMISLIAAQVEKNPDKIKKEGFKTAHVSLLHGLPGSPDHTGWNHDERVESEDMEEMYREFDGYIIEFSNKGPLIEMGESGKKGKIYLPKPAEADSSCPKTTILRTYFFSTCVQKNNKTNNEAQLKLNQDTLQRANAGRNGKNRLSIPATTDYNTAIQFVEALCDTDIALSIGCLSAKDRTGAVGAAVVQNLVSKSLPPGVGNPYASKILDIDSLAVQVVQENTPGFYALKIDPTQSLTEACKFYSATSVKNAARVGVLMLGGKKQKHSIKKDFEEKVKIKAKREHEKTIRKAHNYRRLSRVRQANAT